MTAEKHTCGIYRATMDGKQYPHEKRVPMTNLDNTYDVHFGLNTPKNSQQCSARITNPHLRALGPRALDIQRRGGRTAEDTWRYEGFGSIYLLCDTCAKNAVSSYAPKEYRTELDKRPLLEQLFKRDKKVSITRDFVQLYRKCDGCKNTGWLELIGLDPQRLPRRGFKAHFDEFHNEKEINRKKSKHLFPEDAKRSNLNVSKEPKGYKQDAIHKSDVIQGSEQHGLRWSKAALEWVLKSPGKGKIHFHLDGLGDISKILDKKGDYAYNVTARELRYIKRNWDRFRFCVVFYNGYTTGGYVVEVDKPW